jgi:hypothetical protein
MNFLVLGLLLKHVNLLMHLLDMVAKKCNPNLIKGFMAKMIEVFRCLELEQVYMKVVMFNVSLVFLNL